MKCQGASQLVKVSVTSWTLFHILGVIEYVLWKKKWEYTDVGDQSGKG